MCFAQPELAELKNCHIAVHIVPTKPNLASSNRETLVGRGLDCGFSLRESRFFRGTKGDSQASRASSRRRASANRATS